MPALPEKLVASPCIRHIQSSLVAKGVVNYIPDVSFQAPYSVLGEEKNTLASAKRTQTLPLNSLDECQRR